MFHNMTNNASQIMCTCLNTKHS